eukprot:6689908-Alexandrium_andersonii.AAC.1
MQENAARQLNSVGLCPGIFAVWARCVRVCSNCFDSSPEANETQRCLRRRLWPNATGSKTDVTTHLRHLRFTQRAGVLAQGLRDARPGQHRHEPIEDARADHVQ